MARERISFPVFSFRRIETPFDKRPGYRNYVAVVEAADLPDLAEWRQINVRDPKLTGTIPREIRDSFVSRLDTFVFLNRGMVIAVEAVEFEEKNGILTLVMSDPGQHGLLDGGHTYEIIMRNRDSLRESGKSQYVKVEIVGGFESDELVTLVDARNSSNQVKDESLMNLGAAFAGLRKALKGEPYEDRIAYKEYETYDDGTPKPISVREVIAILMTMDREHFNASVHPINSYRSKAACLKHFRDHPSSFEKIFPIAKDVIRLWEAIHLRLPALYNAVRGERGDVSGGKFGKLTGVAYLEKPATTEFLDAETHYSIPAGFKYPILGAFRAMVVQRGRKYAWGCGLDPVQLLDNGLGKDLARTIGEFALEAKNPSKTGKSQIVWQSCYQSAELAYLRIMHGPST